MKTGIAILGTVALLMAAPPALAADEPVVVAVDADGDGVSDEDERRWGTDPTKEDSDGDGYSDSLEIEVAGALGVAVDDPRVNAAIIGAIMNGTLGQVAVATDPPATEGPRAQGTTEAISCAGAAALEACLDAQRRQLLAEELKQTGLTIEQLQAQLQNGTSTTTEVKLGELVGRQTIEVRPTPGGTVVKKTMEIIDPDSSITRTEVARNWTTGETAARTSFVDEDGEVEVLNSWGNSQLLTSVVPAGQSSGQAPLSGSQPTAGSGLPGVGNGSAGLAGGGFKLISSHTSSDGSVRSSQWVGPDGKTVVTESQYDHGNGTSTTHTSVQDEEGNELYASVTTHDADGTSTTTTTCCHTGTTTTSTNDTGTGGDAGDDDDGDGDASDDDEDGDDDTDDDDSNDTDDTADDGNSDTAVALTTGDEADATIGPDDMGPTPMEMLGQPSNDPGDGGGFADVDGDGEPDLRDGNGVIDPSPDADTSATRSASPNLGNVPQPEFGPGGPETVDTSGPVNDPRDPGPISRDP